jgi:proteic killer suppression protein
MIQSFNCTDTRRLSEGTRVARWSNILGPAMRKLAMLQAAAALSDLKVPPGNRLEALAGTRRGQHSIRVNDQWRICFKWTAGGPVDVEIVDYH